MRKLYLVVVKDIFSHTNSEAPVVLLDIPPLKLIQGEIIEITENVDESRFKHHSIEVQKAISIALKLLKTS